MRILFAAVCLVAVMAVACGGGESEEDRVEAVIRTYFEHYIDSEIEAIYPLLDAASKRSCTEDQFVSVMAGLRDAVGNSEIEFLEVSEIAIEGDRATVTSELRLDELTDSTENILIKEGSDWKLELRPEVCQG